MAETVWSEEIDTLHDHDVNHLVASDGNEYEIHTFCDLVHCETAEILATYKTDFYAGMPALTLNRFGSGVAYYIAARTSNTFLFDFYDGLISKLGIKKNLDTVLPEGVTVQKRTDGENDFLFVMNFSEEQKDIDLGDSEYFDMIEELPSTGKVSLDVYGIKILRRNATF